MAERAEERVMKKTVAAGELDAPYQVVFGDVSKIVDAARDSATRSVNAAMTAAYWLIGHRIVEFEQSGEERATYGTALMERLAADLTQRFGRGFSRQNIQYMRLFYVSYPSDQIRQLDRQINSQFYERTALSKNKAAMLTEGQKPRHEDRVEIKDPFVLEFLDLKDEYSESDLEEALIRHLETFLLELGGDFCFMGRQRRLRIGDKWYRVDLLFFHRRLRCLVVIDLKIGGFTHADAGQMHLYLNYARAHWGREGENPPVGLVLCSEKDEALARYALDGLPNNVMAAEYRITLPNEELLAAEIDRTRQVIESRGSITSEAPLSSGTLTVENPKE